MSDGQIGGGLLALAMIALFSFAAWIMLSAPPAPRDDDDYDKYNDAW